MARILGGLLLAALLLTGCAGGFPADPDGTLDRVTGGVLRVGVSENPPWTVADSDTDPSGLEVDLVREFAATRDAEVQWVPGNEEVLLGRLERGELDLVVGGLTAASPWSDQAALTSPYATVLDPEGAPEPHVMAAPLGENGFLVALETFLLEQEVRP
ncbi:transporter substrate-binding domain-containing protein [Cellulomonas endometrii]|uniref:transporter substrate-binding domain-containing protein n=1 Tax=Cellulomonas endometrii TaxID=3036301 RepID=UPI0024AD1093|nr:transporter substrate-binding domain-containing protein [Cellulomonas endometrii]